MNRIEEIKDRLNNFKTAPREGEAKGLPWDTIQAIGVWADNAPADVEYLLAKLEQAERALEGADEKLAHISSKDFANGQLRYEAATIIQEALKAIRE